MELKAKFKSQQDIVERGEFSSRKVWVTTEDNPEYPQTIEIEVQQTKVNLFNNVAEGAPITLYINLRGREWTNPQGEVKVFNSLVCWKLEADGKTVDPGAAPVKQSASFASSASTPLSEPDGSLPF